MRKYLLTNRDARRFLLAYQNLLPPRQLKGGAGILEHIRRVGCIQYDPINVVGHNPDLVLQSRIAGYRPSMLQNLLYEDRQLLDGWDKNMSIYGLEDWPYFKRLRDAELRRLCDETCPTTAILPQVRDAIQKRGPLSSIDLDFNQSVDCSWAPTRLSRAALESMYFWGELVIHHRVNTRRYYDFASSHIPPDLLVSPDPNPTEEEYQDWYLLRRIGSVGLLWNKASDAWLGMHALKSAQRNAAFKRLLAEGEIVEVSVEGIEPSFFLRTEDEALLAQIQEYALEQPQAAIVAPLDNLIWDRRLVEALFDFHYHWEVYKPVAEREFGYYVLPILYNDSFVARFEPGKDRQSGALIIKNWWWEPGVSQTAEMRDAIARCFQRFLIYLSAVRIHIEDEIAREAHLEFLISAIKS